MLTKIKNFVLYILYIIILIYLALFIPTFWGHKPLVLISGSMEPTLTVGGLLYYEKIEIEDFKKGDIVVFETKEHIISHRIIDKKDGKFITKGDANNTIDNYNIKNSQILGKGTDWSIPYIGYFADYIYTHKYLLFISVAFISIDLFADWYINVKKKYKQKKKTKNKVIN